MASTKIETSTGTLEVRNIMIEIDNTNIEEGLEISRDGEFVIEVLGYHDVDELTEDIVEDLINDNH